MKDQKPQSLSPATYVNLPSKHAHQFRCVANCTFFIATDGAFDIHYIDASGNEIPAEQALKASSAMSQKSRKSGEGKADKKD